MTDRVIDVAVIGGGLAGSLVADSLAQRGLNVTVLESGPSRAGGEAQSRGNGVWPGPVMLEGRKGRYHNAANALLGHGPGGSSALYGAALERFTEADFTGTRPTHADALPTIWPVDAGEMSHWYEAAEHRLGVGQARPALSPRDRSIADALIANGHAPYRLPVAIGYRPGCGECQGQRCARDCKGEGWSRILSDASANGRITLRCDAHVQKMGQGPDGTVHLTLAPTPDDPDPEPVQARAAVLAAGALNSPRLLLASSGLFDEAPHPLIGRGLMFHSSDLFITRPDKALAADGPKKVLGLRGFYDLPEGRGGEIQSLGFDLAPRLVSRYLSDFLAARGIPGQPFFMLALRVPAALLARRLGTPPVLATVIEDLPYAVNRVLAEPDGYDAGAPVRVSYEVSAELSERSHALRREIRKAFAPLPVKFLLQRVAPNLGHPCGSVRMGHDADTAPVDPAGRLRGVAAPVYVADASVFPSSGGTNPALTVAANALRIADGIAESLGADAPEAVRA